MLLLKILIISDFCGLVMWLVGGLVVGGWWLAHLWAELLGLRVEWVFGGCDALSR